MHDRETQGMGTGCLCPCAVMVCLLLFSLQPKVTEFLYRCQQDSELTAMQVFYLIPPENIFFNEGSCVQILRDAQDNDDAAGLLNGQQRVLLRFFPSRYGCAYTTALRAYCRHKLLETC